MKFDSEMQQIVDNAKAEIDLALNRLEQSRRSPQGSSFSSDTGSRFRSMVGDTLRRRSPYAESPPVAPSSVGPAVVKADYVARWEGERLAEKASSAVRGSASPASFEDEVHHVQASLASEQEHHAESQKSIALVEREAVVAGLDELVEHAHEARLGGGRLRGQPGLGGGGSR